MNSIVEQLLASQAILWAMWKEKRQAICLAADFIKREKIAYKVHAELLKKFKNEKKSIRYHL